MAPRKKTQNFDLLSQYEKDILASIPDAVLDKLITIRDRRSVEMLCAKEYMDEEERVHILSMRRAYLELIEQIRSFKQEKLSDREEKLAEIKKRNLVV